jgi:hypothetical protein
MTAIAATRGAPARSGPRGSMKPRRKRTQAKPRTAKVIPLPLQGIVRLTRVAEARRRIETGWYDRADVRDSLVEAVLQEIRPR